jgi:HlyD family secretion protein
LSRQSQAALELAQAKVKEAEATVIETKNKLRRSRELATKGLCTPEECDAAQAAYARAEAALASAKAQVTQAKAQLDAERTALSKAQIHSPINGIVLKRQIEPGQTVAASLQTPVLFTLAENLAQMELHVAVDEADVGQVEEGQKATFTVDAYPDRTFPAVITQVRFAPQTVEGVVTYETILSVDNADLSLRPGMTATADIVVKQLKNAILVPNVALRFSPPIPKAQQAERRGLVASLLPRRPRSSSEDKRKNTSANKGQQRVWILRDSQPVAVPVKTGASNGQMTEILQGDIKPGMQVVVDTISTGR